MELMDIDKILDKITREPYIAFELDTGNKICIPEHLKDEIIFTK